MKKSIVYISSIGDPRKGKGGKSWTKEIKGIDPTKEKGYSLLGNFSQ